MVVIGRQIGSDWSMDEQIKAVLRGFKTTLIDNPALRKFGLGIQATGKTLTWVMGLTPAYFLMMALCIIGGLINFYVVLATETFGGIHLVVGPSHHAQLTYCIFLVCYGAIVGYSKRMELLAIGSVIWGYYALQISIATLQGIIVPQGMLATLYLIIGVFAIAGRIVERARREQAEKELRESTATLQAYKALKENTSLG